MPKQQKNGKKCNKPAEILILKLQSPVANDMHPYHTISQVQRKKSAPVAHATQSQFCLLYVSGNIFYRPTEALLTSFVYLNNQSNKNPNMGQPLKGICLATTSRIGPKQQTCSAASGIQTVVFQVRLRATEQLASPNQHTGQTHPK
jgi:hypothetical protein